MTVPKTGVLPLHHGSIRGTKIVFSPKNQSFSEGEKPKVVIEVIKVIGL